MNSASANNVDRYIVIAKRIYPNPGTPQKYYEAMWVEQGKIKALGSAQEFRKIAMDKQIPLYDHANRVILPGLIETHLHLYNLGKWLSQVHLNDVTSIAELQSRVQTWIKKHASILDQQSWIIGSGWDQYLFQEQRFPTRADLDQITPSYPILLYRACRHIAVANSKALGLANISAQTPDPPGGEIERFDDGSPTGLLKETAIDLITAHIPSPTLEQQAHYIEQAISHLLSFGITSAYPNDKHAWPVYQYLEQSNRLHLRIYWIGDFEELETFESQGLVNNCGTPMLRIGGFKLFADGSLGGKTAALREPYQNSTSKGMLIYPEGVLESHILNIVDAGFQPWVHAIGDKAAEIVVNAFMMAAASNEEQNDPSLSSSTSVLSQLPAQECTSQLSDSVKHLLKHDPRFVLVHAQVLAPDLITQMADASIIAAIQPVFIMTDKRWAEEYLGSERIKYAYAWKSLINAGVPCIAGSDAPIEPVNPWRGVFAAVTRQDINGKPPTGWRAEEKLDISTALTLFTSQAAYASYAEHWLGTLDVGKYADYVELSIDPFQLSSSQYSKLLDPIVEATIVGGIERYNRLQQTIHE